MSRGEKKIKVAGWIANYSCTFTMVILIYIFFAYFQHLGYFRSHFSQSARTTFVTLLVIYIIGNVYRSFAAGYIQRSAYIPDRSRKVIAHGIAELILSGAWLMIMIIQTIHATWLVTVEGISVLLLVMSIIDIIAFSVVIYGAIQNRDQGYAPMELAAGSKKEQLPPITPYPHNAQNLGYRSPTQQEDNRTEQ